MYDCHDPFDRFYDSGDAFHWPCDDEPEPDYSDVEEEDYPAHGYGARSMVSMPLPQPLWVNHFWEMRWRSRLRRHLL